MQNKISKITFYFSFIFILPLIWYLVEKHWLIETNEKIQEKRLEIGQKTLNLPLVWQRLTKGLNLSHQVELQPQLSEKISSYQKAVELIWDNLKENNPDFQLSIAQVTQLTKSTEFIQEISQTIQEYNSDALLFNQSLKSWAGKVISSELEMNPAPIIGIN